MILPQEYCKVCDDVTESKFVFTSFEVMVFCSQCRRWIENIDINDYNYEVVFRDETNRNI